MVAEVGSNRFYLGYGSHHEAAYRACIFAMIQESQAGNEKLIISTTSQHVVKQMAGEWEVGEELEALHQTALAASKLLPVTFVWERG